MAKRQQNTFDILVLTSLLFFTSGSTGLAYEVIWSKRFTHIWGSSSLAMASVVASFLFGLGLGALLFGRVADRVKRPLFWYGVAEIIIGLLAAVIPFEIVELSDLAIRIYPSLPDVESVRFLVRCGLTLLVIGPPCVLMGGTLPLLIRQFTPRDGELGAVVGWLYAINTFGAAAGCAIAGFYLLPAWGLEITNYGTAALNLVIGGVSIALSAVLAQRLSEDKAAPAPTSTAKPRPAPVSAASTATPARYHASAVYVSVALTGLAALILQMVWVRQLSLVLGGSTYAFTATLFVVLVAIALGSLIYQFALQRFVSHSFLPIAVLALLAASTAGGTLLLPWLSTYASGWREVRYSWTSNAQLCLLAAGIVQFLPGIAMGILFPLLVDLTHAAAAAVGRTVGNIYAWNTLGSIVGATFTSFYLIPWIGTIGTVAFALALYFVAGLFMLLPIGFAARRIPIWAGYAAVACLVVGGVWHYGTTADPLQTNFGLYMYDVSTRIPDVKVAYFKEGASSNVLVISHPAPNPKKPQRSLRVNGKVDASTGLDMPTQLGLALFPRFFNPRAKEVLVIGFGSGTTSGASLLFPGTQVTCCEIEPAVFAASEQFASVNFSPQQKTRAWLEAENAKLPADKRKSPEQIEKDATFKVVYGDGRTVLQTSPHKFDLIISEPSNPWLAGVSNLFTQQFFEAAKRHLNEGGVLAQWIQTYNFKIDDYALIARTLRTVFPHAGVVCLTKGADTILLASDKPLLPSQADIDYLQQQIDASPILKESMVAWFSTTDVRRLLLRHYYLDEEGLDRFSALDESSAGRNGTINTDLNMKLEFDAPLRLFSHEQPEVFPGITKVAESDWTSKLAQEMGSSPTTAQFFTDLAYVAAERGDVRRAAEFYRRAIDVDSNYLQAYHELATLYQNVKKNKEAIEVLSTLVKKLPEQSGLRIVLAGLLVQEKRPNEGIAQYREALRLDPNSVLASNNLAWILATHPNPQYRDGREAVKLATLACNATQNSNPGLLDTLAAAYAEVGEFDRAVSTIRVASEVAQKRNELPFVAAAKGRMDRYQQRKPYREG